MQVFIKKLQGMDITFTLNVESCELIRSVNRRLEEEVGIRSDVVQILIYEGKHLDEFRTLAHYNILNGSTLHLLTRKRLPHIYVKIVLTRKIITLSVMGLNTVDDVKTKIYDREGILPDEQRLLFACRQLDGNQTLLENHIGMESTLHLVLLDTILSPEVPQSGASQLTQLNVTSQGQCNQRKNPAPQVAPPQTKRARPATQATPTSRSRESELEATISRLTRENKELSSLCGSYEIQTVALKAENKKTKEELTVACKKKKELGVSYESQIVALKAENKETKEELTVAHRKEKEQEATIFGLTHQNKMVSARCASYESQIVALEAENKKTIKELMVARSKEKELEATISGLTHQNKTVSAQCASYESQIVALEAENKKTIKELMVACSKENELEVSISGLTHKNKVFSAQCVTYERQVIALEAEYKKTKEELLNADRKYYSGARAAGYAEGLKEGKTKWLKSVEFLHHLTDASMQYFNYGFDSCQKQAEQQGFVGQLDKDSALKEAPEQWMGV